MYIYCELFHQVLLFHHMLFILETVSSGKVDAVNPSYILFIPVTVQSHVVAAMTLSGVICDLYSYKMLFVPVVLFDDNVCIFLLCLTFVLVLGFGGREVNVTGFFPFYRNPC